MTGTRLCVFILFQLTAVGLLSGKVFEDVIQPIFAAHCTSCHGGAQPAGGLDLTSLASTVKGGAKGAVLVKGASEKSVLYQKISSRSMPPPNTAKALPKKR